MAYQVDKFNGTFLVSVEDGTIDTTTDLRFVGKNYAGYGEVQNENFLHLLENFSNSTSPPKVIRGQIWFDSANNKLKFYDGSRYKVAGGAEASASAPSGLTTGDFWWNTSSKQLYAWTGTDFALVGPETSPDLGSSTVAASVVQDSSLNSHTILKMFSDNKVVGIFSKDAFTLAAGSAIEDFTVIKKGLTLAKSQSGVGTDDYVMWGTANNANFLGGFAASQYLKIGENEFTEEVSFKDPGFSVGDGNDLRIRVENGDEVIVENRLGNDITFRITVTETSDERDVAIIRPTGVIPGNDNVYTLGISGSRWNNIYSTTVTGNLVGNVTGNSTGSHTGNVLATDTTVMINATTKQIGYTGATLVGTLTGSVTGSAASATNSSKLNDLDPSITVPGGGVASIPVRDTSGNITAVQFVGISDKSDRIRINNSATDPTITGNISAASTADQYRTAMTTQTAWTIAARDGNADLTARVFNGTATSARYADLAEKYLADAEYEVGTVVMVGGEAEVTASVQGSRAIGVVSENPAFMMNSELEGGTYIALKGRVPVKVFGPVTKGDRLIADNNGCAMALKAVNSDTFAIALETNLDNGEKTIEALVL
jgi:hypothetical protein